MDWCTFPFARFRYTWGCMAPWIPSMARFAMVHSGWSLLRLVDLLRWFTLQGVREVRSRGHCIRIYDFWMVLIIAAPSLRNWPKESTLTKLKLNAALVAIKFAYDLLKLATAHGGGTPSTHLVFDNTSVGQQTVGTWACRSHPELGKAVRHLVHLTERRFDFSFQTHHVYGHCGDPGNEIVDTLAKRAAEGKATTDLRDFISFQMTERFLRSAEWFWFLFRTDLHCFWSEKSLKLPAKPSTSPAVDLLDCTEGLEKDSHTAVGNLNIKIAIRLMYFHSRRVLNRPNLTLEDPPVKNFCWNSSMTTRFRCLPCRKPELRSYGRVLMTSTSSWRAQLLLGAISAWLCASVGLCQSYPDGSELQVYTSHMRTSPLLQQIPASLLCESKLRCSSVLLWPVMPLILEQVMRPVRHTGKNWKRRFHKDTMTGMSSWWGTWIAVLVENLPRRLDTSKLRTVMGRSINVTISSWPRESDCPQLFLNTKKDQQVLGYTRMANGFAIWLRWDPPAMETCRLQSLGRTGHRPCPQEDRPLCCSTLLATGVSDLPHQTQGSQQVAWTRSWKFEWKLLLGLASDRCWLAHGCSHPCRDHPAEHLPVFGRIQEEEEEQPQENHPVGWNLGVGLPEEGGPLTPDWSRSPTEENPTVVLLPCLGWPWLPWITELWSDPRRSRQAYRSWTPRLQEVGKRSYSCSSQRRFYLLQQSFWRSRLFPGPTAIPKVLADHSQVPTSPPNQTSGIFALSNWMSGGSVESTLSILGGWHQHQCCWIDPSLS